MVNMIPRIQPLIPHFLVLSMWLATTSVAHPTLPHFPKTINATQPLGATRISNTTTPEHNLFAPAPSPRSHTYASFLASLITGTAILAAIFVLVFWLCRHRVRARRRRLGEMMGLAGWRDGILRRVEECGQRSKRGGERGIDGSKDGRRKGSVGWK